MEIRQAANFAIDFANEYTGFAHLIDREIAVGIALAKFDPVFKLMIADYTHSDPYRGGQAVWMLSCSGEFFDLNGRWGEDSLLPGNALSLHDQDVGGWRLIRTAEIEAQQWYDFFAYDPESIAQIEKMAEVLLSALQSYQHHEILQQHTRKARSDPFGSRL